MRPSFLAIPLGVACTCQAWELRPCPTAHIEQEDWRRKTGRLATRTSANSGRDSTEISWKEIPETLDNSKGESFKRTFVEASSVISHQLGNQSLKGVKGLIFHGDPGNGKTLMAKVVAKELQLSLFVDGSVITKELYGQSERQIVKDFLTAQSKQSLMLIEEAESVFPDGNWMKGESWHVAHNNILFHQNDDVVTSQTSLIMTTNEFQLLDNALKDRLYAIEFPHGREHRN